MKRGLRVLAAAGSTIWRRGSRPRTLRSLSSFATASRISGGPTQRARPLSSIASSTIGAW